MSKSAMLRTRRRDVNVKPNRRLDRKSSRGMIYENEELRLRTININAEIERGQSDIKKLRRENEQLRKEIWCLRDEYEKLDKLLKEKGENTSCSSCSSDTDSCSSCTESEENETTQNIENVQKTTLNHLRTEFDHLSVVTEETSAENSDKNSVASPKEFSWDAIPPDQSYPNSQTLPVPTTKPTLLTDQMPKHFFAPLKPNETYDNRHENNICMSGWSLGANNSQNCLPFVNFDQNFNKQSPIVLPAQRTVLPTSNLPAQLTNCGVLPKIDLQTCKKTTPDIVMKTDFANYSQESNSNSFINGGNLDELLHDIETISKDILEISTQNDVNQKLTNSFEQLEAVDESRENVLEETKVNSNERPYKSELNVVLMPKAMPLLGFDKYHNIKSSMESVETLKKSSESLLEIPTPENNLPHIPTPCFTPQPFPIFPSEVPIPLIPPPINPPPELTRQPSNPFFYGTFDNYQNPEAFTNRYKPDTYAHDNLGFKNDLLQNNALKTEEKDEKTNIENEIVESKTVSKTEKIENDKNDSKKEPGNKKEETQQKSPKLRRTRKVSIYFKGKKDKLARSLSLDTKMIHEDTPKLFNKSPVIDDRKANLLNPKTSNTESKMSIFDGLSPKNPDSLDKTVNSDTNKTSSDSKNSNYDRKHRKSSSTSPERKHVHVKLENEKKCHKKRHKKSERRIPPHLSNSVNERLRERSFSMCTDRSNILDHKFGHSEDYTNSERDRSNSLSSCDTVKSRKMSTVPQIQVSGKIPWFGCWGNGCL